MTVVVRSGERWSGRSGVIRRNAVIQILTSAGAFLSGESRTGRIVRSAGEILSGAIKGILTGKGVILTGKGAILTCKAVILTGKTVVLAGEVVILTGSDGHRRRRRVRVVEPVAGDTGRRWLYRCRADGRGTW